jgi:GNAT superfamily N-acetyltransferase
MSEWVIREVTTTHEIGEVKRLVRAHGDARRETPGVEYVYADAERMPGPYVPPRGGLWVAMHGDTGIGCVALRPIDRSSAEVKRMFVDATWRGRGVGRALLEALITAARAKRYRVLKLGTLDDMHAAQALYNSLGFTPVPRYRNDELIDTRFYELALTS